MIEPTDASKCDERQVKNKPNRLTQKRKGETRRMSSESMKHWKVSLFFVISLMLVAGLFADTASAQRGTVSIRPVVMGDSGEVLSSVRIGYTVTTGIPGRQDQSTPATEATGNDETITDEIIIALPSDWGAAVGDFGSTTTIARDGQRQGVWYSKADGDRGAGQSYVEVDTRFAAAADTSATRAAPVFAFTAAGQVTVMVTGNSNPDLQQIGATSAGDRIIVTYHNVKVHPLTAAEIIALAANPHMEYFIVFENTNYRTTAADDTTEEDFRYHDPTNVASADDTSVPTTADITALTTTDKAAFDAADLDPVDFNVTLPTQSTVAVRPSGVKAGAPRDTVTLTYTVQDSVFEPNVITFRLPIAWMPQTIGEMDDAGYNTFGTTFADATATSGHKRTTVDTSTNPATTAHITVDARFARRPGGAKPFLTDAATPLSNLTLAAVTSPTGDAEVQVTVPSDNTAPMLKGDTITVTFHKVKVRELRGIEFESTDMIRDPVLVEDDIDGSMYDVSIRVLPPKASDVSVVVTPTLVKAESKVNVKVTYVVEEDTLYGNNNITIGLPLDWGPAYRASTDTDVDSTTKSFGTMVLTTLPSNSSVRTKTSYVVWKLTKKSTSSPATVTAPAPTIGREEYDAYVDIPVTGGMIKGDKIEVTFHNVMVQALDAREPANVSLTVTDDIPNSAATYASRIMIAVQPPTSGDVSILSGKTVPAEGMVDLKIRYAATEVLAGKDGDDTYSGRIRVELPMGWTHQSDDSEIFKERPVGKPDATYLSLVGSSSAVLSAKPVLSVSASSPHVINIDVSQMRNRQQVTLTIHNLMIDALMAKRVNRHTPLTAAMAADKVQVKVFSGRYESSGLRDGSDPTRAPATIHKDFRISPTAGGSDTQPTITVNRKTLGEVDITPAKVPAGSVTNFKIAYKLTEDMDDNDVIEITLPPYLTTSPASWTAPSISVRKPKSPPKTSHVYLSGTVTRLEPTIRVIDGGGVVDATAGEEPTDKSWIVQIALGTGKKMSKGGTITLHYDRAVVQRALATNDPAKTVEPKKLVIKTFSGDESVNGMPQYPAAEMIKDTIEVTVAADGSGMVMFEHDGNDVTTMKGTMKSQEDGEEDTYVKFVSNTDVSIPAGLNADDLRQLVVEYIPAGNMGTDGEFEVRLPSGWTAADSLVSGGEKDSDNSHPTNSDDTVVVDLFDNFGETSTDRVYITFTDITVPNKHGEVEFTAKSKSGSARAQLASSATAFVGNAEAMYDTVAVNITPDAAYENEEKVNFVIELTNTGPLHDSEIQITVPEGLSGLSNDPKNASKDNYVRMVSTTARSVRLSTLDIIDEDIIVKTGKLNAAGKIVIHFNNVDIRDITETDNANGEDADTGFRVSTRTRVPAAVAKEDDDVDYDFASFEDPTEVDYARIEKADGKRAIMGGLIRIVAGSGRLAVKPRVVEQNSLNQTITLTYTAATDIIEKNLVVQLPSVIERIVGVSPARKETSGRTLTWEKQTISEGHSFIVTITGVDFLGYTGDFHWITTLDGTQLLDKDNPPMVVVGTTKTDVAFDIVENGGVAVLDPSYPAASEQSIRFQFTAENTAIQDGGRLRFKVPGGRWTAPSDTDRAGKATVGIVTTGDDGEDILVDQLPADTGSKMMLKVTNRDVTLNIGPDGFAKGESVIIQYGTAEFPVEIPANKAGTPENLMDGLAIHGSYLVSGPVSGKTFRMHSAGIIWIDVTNVDDGAGTANVRPPSVRASSTNNLMRIVYTGAGTMDGGAVQLIIPNGWGDAQRSDDTAANYMNVTVGTGAVLKDFEVHDSGRTVEANLTTFGFGDTVMFTYGGTGAKGAEAPAEIGDSIFIVEAKGSSNGTFTAVESDELTVKVMSAAAGSGTVVVKTMKNKAGEEDGQINAGDDQTYLVFTYTAEQTIAGDELDTLEFIVPSEWTDPQQEDTNQAGYTYIYEGNALVTDEDYDGDFVVTATIQMSRGDMIEIRYGWYDAENGGAHAPQAAGSYDFQVKFGGELVDTKSVIVYGGTASQLMVDAPSTVSADPEADPVAITVEIQDDTDTATVSVTDLEVTLSSTSSTGSFADADGEAIVDNKVTIPAGITKATAFYSDTGAGTTATIIATAVGLSSGTDPITVTSDIDRVDANSVSVSHATAKAGDTVTVTASGTAGRTATFSVGAIVTTMGMTESPANSGSYSGSFPVADDLHDGTYNVMVSIGDMSATVENAITIDTTAPIISGASATPATVGNGDVVTITAMATGATSVTADVSALDSTQTSVALMMANGSYSIPVTISDENAALNGSKTITVTAMDAAGNSAMSTAMVTLDNKLSYTSMIPAGTSLFHVPLDVDGLDTVGDLKAALGNVSLAIVYDSAAGSWNSRSDAVMITADLGMILTTTAAVTHTFEGQAWGGGASTISLKAGSNLIGLPVNAPNVTNVSDIMTLFGTGVVASIVVSTDDGFAAVSAAGAASDGPVMGDAAYLVTATADATAAVVGTGWSHAATGAAPVALTGYSVGSQTPVLDVQGAVVDEITGLAREGFRVKVKNLSTKASLSKVTSVEMTEGYNMTFVDLKAANAARIGDVLEIFADSPNPLIGVKPVRHIVTVDDVKNSTIQLENLIAYEIPAETELLRNYPNPFNPETWIPYHLAEDANVSLTIYDVNGALVRDIDVGHQIAAKYDTRSKAIYWDGRNRFGEQVASGIYFYSLSAGDFSATRKMVILK